MPQGALYRSQNRATSWTWVGGPFGGSVIAAIDADRSLPGRLFAATSAGVYRTDDGGAHWAKVSALGFATLLGDREPESLATTPGALYVTAGPRLLVSPDGGRNFDVRFEVLPGGGLQFAADPFRAGWVYLSYSVDGIDHLTRSTNAGKSWSEVEAVPVSGSGWIEKLTAVGGAVYFQSSGDDPALWRSRDGGATWQRLLDGDIGVLLIHPTKPRALYLTRSRSGEPQELLVSRDGGDTWRILGSPPFYLQRLAIEPNTGTFYGLKENGYQQSALLRSVDGKAWETVFVTPSSEAEVARISFRPGRPKHQALTVGWSLYRSFDGGASWTWRALPFRPGDVALGHDPNRLIAISGLQAYLSEDAGRTWRATSSSLFYGEGLIRSDRDTLFAIGCGVVRSTDDGESWRVVLPCFATNAETGRWTAKLDVDPARPEKVYALSFQAKIDGLPHGPLNDWPSFLWRSEDGGTTWKKIATNLRAFALERGTGRLYGVRGTKLLISDDAGRNWRIVGTGPSEALDLIGDPATPGALFANGRGGLQWSPDRGATWATVNPGGGWVLQFDPTNPKAIYTATEDGVYRLALP
jgi:photosystem II stability/assembly factor-like uncharacterized protein